MDRQAFMDRFGGVFEHSPWIAAAVYDAAAGDIPSDPGPLGDRFEEVVMAAGSERQLVLLRAHPELACGQAEENALTRESRREQAGAGLERCSPDEYRAFRRLNEAYREKFGFPFIIAVRGLGRKEILHRFEARLSRDRDEEFNEALRQVCRIGRLRIEEALDA